MTPELCIAAANSIAARRPTPTQFPYVFLEYHNECYGGMSLNFAGSTVTSLYGPGACTDVCSGSVTRYTTTGSLTRTTTVTSGTVSTVSRYTTTGDVTRTSTILGNMCGGSRQFNLYVLSTPVAFPATGLPMKTESLAH
ncbi:hypothetical protein GE09DRAFT_1214861 [Coniochaeta sp. 2T2.1]|nr:hypothetical protein GE09DRAFT_1214861 [Coniochaeta sp. 2T2.1]